MTFMNAVITLP